MARQSFTSTEMLTLQADVFSQYLIGQTPSDTARQIFVRSMRNVEVPAAAEAELLLYGLKHPWSLRFIDAYLALFKPESELRRRIYITFAILECMPEYYEDFMPKQRGFWYILVVFYRGLVDILYAAIGAVIVGTM